MSTKKRKTKQERIDGLLSFLEKKAKLMRLKKTKWEQILYKTLKELHYNFKNQVPIICKEKYGYIVDFLLVDYNLIIEADSKQYHSSRESQKLDNQRTRRLKKEGYNMLRLWNSQISVYTKEQINDIIRAKIALLSQIVKQS